MTVNKIYAMSSFLQFRYVYAADVKFSDKLDFPLKSTSNRVDTKVVINTAQELCDFLKNYVSCFAKDGKAALALSGGIDSALLAKFMPKGSVAYTFECVVPGRQVITETARAKQYCDINRLKHHVIEIFWDDYEKFSPILMKRKNAPIHSIEVQIYKAALQAKRDGFDRIIFGNLADVIFGGFDGLLAKDWTIGEFIERFSYVLPYRALRDFTIITDPFKTHCTNGRIDAHSFINDIFSNESSDSYINACAAADIESVDAYLPLEHNPVNLTRIRSGDSKYVVREAFRLLYPGMNIPEKIPMFRAVDEWLKGWRGPKRSEFWENCHVNMTGNQKYYVWILEKFLNIFDIS